MPELPEVETTRQSLLPLIGCRIVGVAVSQLRLRLPIPMDLHDLVGYQLTAVKRRAKYLLLHFVADGRDEKILLVHLGMSGSLGQYALSAPRRKHDHVVFCFDNEVALCYHDPRRFGMVVWQADAIAYLANLGIEPLSDAFDGQYLYDCIHRGKRAISRPIKSVLMTQSIVVGVGNIYATESLFLAGIHPSVPAADLTCDKLAVLVGHVKAILERAITVGGTTLKDFRVGDNQTGYFQQTLLAYGRKGLPCVNCHLPLDVVKIDGRASVFCPACQPLPSPLLS